MEIKTSATARTVHTIRIEGRINEPQIYAAAAAALEAGCTHFRIVQPHPLNPAAMWVAGAGRAARPMGNAGVSDPDCAIERSERR